MSFIEDAQEIDLEFTDLPFTIEGFFTLLEFPEYLAERARSWFREFREIALMCVVYNIKRALKQ